MITASCSCGKQYRLDDDKAGKKMRCGVCRAVFDAPTPALRPPDDDPLALVDDAPARPPPSPRPAAAAAQGGGAPGRPAAAPGGKRRPDGPTPKWRWAVVAAAGLVMAAAFTVLWFLVMAKLSVGIDTEVPLPPGLLPKMSEAAWLLPFFGALFGWIAWRISGRQSRAAGWWAMALFAIPLLIVRVFLPLSIVAPRIHEAVGQPADGASKVNDIRQRELKRFEEMTDEMLRAALGHEAGVLDVRVAAARGQAAYPDVAAYFNRSEDDYAWMLRKHYSMWTLLWVAPAYGFYPPFGAWDDFSQLGNASRALEEASAYRKTLLDNPEETRRYLMDRAAMRWDVNDVYFRGVSKYFKGGTLAWIIRSFSWWFLLCMAAGFVLAWRAGTGAFPFRANDS